MSPRIYKRYRAISYPKCNEHFIYYKPKLKAYIIPDPSTLSEVAKELGVELETFNTDIPLEHIALALTYSCNLNCSYCFTKKLFKSRPPSLDLSLVNRLLNEAKNLGLLSVTITGGEPLLYRDLFKLLDSIVSLDLVVRAIESNGVLLTVEFAKRLLEYRDITSSIAISLDGPINVHEAIRGYGTFPKAMKSIKILTDLGFNVVVNTIISRDLTLLSYGELRDFLNLLIDLGVKEVNFIDLYAPEGTSLKPSYEELLRFSTFMNNLYREFKGKLYINLSLPPPLLPEDLREKVRALNANSDKPCNHNARSVYVRADGSVVPCSLWEDALGIFGNIKTSSIEKIWHSIATFMENVKNFINLNCGNCILFKEELCGFWNICIVRGCYYGRWRSADFDKGS